MSGLIDTDIADLALFVRVVEAGGFSAASRTVGRPQGTISRRIAELETRLGVRLLDRSTRRVVPTEAGRRVYAEARPMLDRAEAARHALSELASEPSGALRITAPLILGQAFLCRIVTRFMAENRKVKVRLYLTGRIVDLVEEGFDVAIRVGNLPDSSMKLTRLGTAERGLYSAPEYLAESAPIADPADLAGHPNLAPGTSLGPQRLSLRRGDERVLVEMEARMACNDVLPRLEAVRNGLGVADLPRFSAAAAVAVGDLVEVLPDWSLANVDISALTPSGNGAPRVVTDFLAHARRHLKAELALHNRGTRT